MEIQYTIQPVDNDGSYTTNQVVRCTLNGAELVPGTRLDIETDIITIEVAGLKPEPTPTAQCDGGVREKLFLAGRSERGGT